MPNIKTKLPLFVATSKAINVIGGGMATGYLPVVRVITDTGTVDFVRQNGRIFANEDDAASEAGRIARRAEKQLRHFLMLEEYVDDER